MKQSWGGGGGSLNIMYGPRGFAGGENVPPPTWSLKIGAQNL